MSLICWWHCWGAASWGSFLRTANGINPNRTNVKHKMENHDTFVYEWVSLHSSPQHNACQNICPWISKDHRNKEGPLVHSVKSNNFLTCTWDKSSHLWHAHLSTTSIFCLFVCFSILVSLLWVFLATVRKSFLCFQRQFRSTKKGCNEGYSHCC